MKYFYIIFIFLFSTSLLLGQSAAIAIDENFDDWNSGLKTYVDGEDNPGGIDFLDMQVTNDENYLYIKFSLNTELCLGNDLVNQNIWLNIDADNDPSTGYSQSPDIGSELSIGFKDHYAWFNPPNSSTKVTFGSIGLVVAPTVTATTFEMAIDRNAVPDGINPLFTGDTIRILIKERKDNDNMPNDGDIFYYVFDNTPVTAFVPLDTDKKNPSDIRVVNYNVHHNDGWSGAGFDQMKNVITALKGDIYCLQESSKVKENKAKKYMDSWLPTGTSEGWYIYKEGNIITFSKWPILKTWKLWNQIATLIDLPDSFPNDILIVDAHLTCCKANSKRQQQADEFASFLIDAKSPGGDIDLPESTPIVFAGDMNLVGYAQQRKTIITGDIQDTTTYGTGGPLDWDDTDLGDALPYLTEKRMVYTWREPTGDGFPPGRLDYQFYTDAVLNQENAFVLQTEIMDSTRLAQIGLNSEDTQLASDHLPVTVDYSFVHPMASNDTDKNKINVTIYPNPVSGLLNIKSQGKPESIVLRNLFGDKVLSIAKGTDQINVTNIPEGIYLLDIVIDGVKSIQKVMVLH